MPAEPKPTPVYIHTLDTLCDELVSGRAIAVDDAGDTLRFEHPKTRSVFDWYRKNRMKWGQRNRKEDVEAIVGELDSEPPECPPLEIPDVAKKPRTLHLKSVRIRRFGGVHRYGAATNPPKEFCLEFNEPIMVIEGKNGSGKTSLLSAIVWCLTGYVYRSQRPPETASDSVHIRVDQSEAEEAQTEQQEISPITPLPSAEVLGTLGTESVPLDTEVKLVFADEQGQELPPVSRAMSRSARGKIKITEPDFKQLGVDPIALEVGTKLPGLIPYIRLDEQSDLGTAVAELTGISALRDLVTHARKTKAKLETDLVQDRESQIRMIDKEYNRTKEDLERLIRENPSVDPKTTVPDPAKEKAAEKALKTCKERFEEMQSRALAESKSVLGEDFDPRDNAARKDLMANVGRAMGLLEKQNLARLLSAIRLKALAGLSKDQLEKAEALCGEIVGQAEELAQLDKKPDVAARLRLYARVAGWINSLPDEVHHDVTHCPVCLSALQGKRDQVTEEPIIDHLERYLKADTDYLEKAVPGWEKATMQRLAKELPEELASELSRDLPAKPADLIEEAIVKELFDTSVFKSSLLPMKSAAENLCGAKLALLPAFDEPDHIELPKPFAVGEGSVAEALNRICRAIAFARWRHAAQDACKKALGEIVGESQEDQEKPAATPKDVEAMTLMERLEALDRLIKNATPVTEALSRVELLCGNLKAREAERRRISKYAETAKAIEPLLKLGSLVDAQVGSLMARLSSETTAWRRKFYVPSFAGAPQVKRPDVWADGTLALEAEAEGTLVSARHVSNASDLKATLLAFLLAFWEYLLRERGGLSLLLLDDIQELFDGINRRRIANSLPEIAGRGARVILTTNDHDFGQRVAAAGRRAEPPISSDHHRIHPPNAQRLCIELSPFIEEIDRRRHEFEDPANENKHQPARDYIKQLRIYLEHRLLDFFDVPVPRLPRDPTLADLIDGVRKRRKDANEPFKSQAFEHLVSDPALVSDSEFIKIMNLSHHHKETEITYGDVKHVAGDCIRVRKEIDAAHEEYERWLCRDPSDSLAPPSVIPAAGEPISLSVPIIENLAAFTESTPPGEPSDGFEQFTFAELGEYAIYAVRTHNFGFACPQNCRAIVSLADDSVPDRCLVIALHGDKTYARRLIRDQSRPEVVALGSEAQDPSQRAPSLVLPTREVKLLKVIGILFDHEPIYPRSREEATLDPNCRILKKVTIAFEAIGDSALPLALPRQLILGGDPVLPNQLTEVDGQIVALATTEGAMLKRVGATVPGMPYLRQFESIGGMGGSLLVRTEDVEDAIEDLPLLNSLRQILGIIYREE